jgi:CBS domain containing-hemolysin-like protein
MRESFSMNDLSMRRARRVPRAAMLVATLLAATTAQASMFQGEALDKAADVLAWVVLIVVPLAGLWLFWLVHILPEKIAEQKGHPQAPAIKTLCLLSLVFGGMLWPIAWLWAYTKPVMYKMAYGTDRVDHHAEAEPVAPAGDEGRTA